jgi:hypothetical protein
MATAKYNWQEIKQKYLASDILEVKQFLGNFLAISLKQAQSGVFTKNTTGWRDEKEQIKKEQTEKAKKDLENDPNVKIANNNILKAINNIETKVALLLGSGEKFSKEDLPKIKVGWEMLRVSQNLPTTYAKNENDNKNLEVQILKTITQNAKSDQS